MPFPAAVPDADAAPPPAAWRRLLAQPGTTSFLFSLVFHIALLLVLSMLVQLIAGQGEATLVVTSSAAERIAAEESELSPLITADAAPGSREPLIPDLAHPSGLTRGVDDVLRGTAEQPLRSSSTDDMTAAAMVLHSRNVSGGGYEGRSAERKGDLVRGRGGNERSENAVAMGLAWLAAHQWQDGGWRFDLTTGPCGGQCRHSGIVGTTTGATGLALLPFLGAGHTHEQGSYQEVVNRGLYYLRSRMIIGPEGGDLQEGTMYAHGIATTALCEAYAMTRDAALRQPAQRAIDFICHAQHSAGGWRYYPGQPGDTTVFGWQMMALKSAAMAGLDVPSPVTMLAERFLDSVQTDDGAQYGYVGPARDPGPTAIGLLIRMYTGWPREDSRLQRGAHVLSRLGPSQSDMYFNYYATQVLHHFEGPTWPRWNEAMRDYLIRTQAVQGHERGSWHFEDRHGTKGGRLYTTAMCVMILEVYYRHMPLYDTRAVNDGL